MPANPARNGVSGPAESQSQNVYTVYKGPKPVKKNYSPADEIRGAFGALFKPYFTGCFSASFR